MLSSWQIRASRFLYRFFQVAWKGSLIALVVTFFVSWMSMRYFEPADNAITSFGDYVWFFDVTGKTIGYGDKFPVTTGGRITSMITSFVTIPVYITLMVSVPVALFARTQRIKQGKGRVRFVDKHTIIIGNDVARIKALVTELQRSCDNYIVVCSDPAQIAEDPFASFKRLIFVSGDLEDPEFYVKRAELNAASSVVVDAGDDRLTASIITSIRHVNVDVHVVAALRSMGYAAQLQRISRHDSEIDAVPSELVGFVAKAALQPGTVERLIELASTSDGSGDMYVLKVPRDVPQVRLNVLSAFLLQEHQAQLATIQVLENGDRSARYGLPADAFIEPGSEVLYIARNEITTEIPWARLVGKTVHLV